MIDADLHSPRQKNTPAPHRRGVGLRVALAHDWLVAMRGGELVLDAIARLLIDDHHSITALYTMFGPRSKDHPPLTAALSALSALVAWMTIGGQGEPEAPTSSPDAGEAVSNPRV